MRALEQENKTEINQVVKQCLEDSSIIFSDKIKRYQDISNLVEIHIQEKSTKTTTNTILKWVHIAISIAKRAFLGIYHKIKGKYPQNYLDEFCFKLNRR